MVEFTWISVLFMILILGLIWGGFILVIALAIRFEKDKKEEEDREGAGEEPGGMP